MVKPPLAILTYFTFELPIKINDSGTTAFLPVTLLPPEILLRTGRGLSKPLPSSHRDGYALLIKAISSLPRSRFCLVTQRFSPGALRDETKMAVREITPFLSCLNPLF